VSARTTLGIITPFKKDTAKANTSSMRFMVVFSLFRKVNSDTLMAAKADGARFLQA
jgi:hypothetical protein